LSEVLKVRKFILNFHPSRRKEAIDILSFYLTRIDPSGDISFTLPMSQQFNVQGFDFLKRAFYFYQNKVVNFSLLKSDSEKKQPIVNTLQCEYLDRVKKILDEVFEKIWNNNYDISYIEDELSEMKSDGFYHSYDVSDEVNKLEGFINESDVNNQIFLNKLMELEVEFLGITSLTKVLHQSGEQFSLKDIKDCNLCIESGATLTEIDTTIMRNIYSQNQAEVGAHDEILAHFDERVKDPNTKFYIFKWQNKIQSFVAFTAAGENLFEATSFNVDPAARGYKIGEAMLEEAISKEAKEHVLYGECYAKLKIAAKYIETGWIAEKYFTEPGKDPNSVDTLMNIYRDDAHSSQYWGKSTTSPEAIYGKEGIPEFVRVEEAGSQLGLPLYLLNEGYVMTRMFYYEPQRKFVGVFEPDARAEQVVDQAKRLNQTKRESEAESVGV
jgi:N-acetylglutamate synthase-like GNAT family acetyltransferase